MKPLRVSACAVLIAGVAVAQSDDWWNAPTVPEGAYAIDPSAFTPSPVAGRCFGATPDAWVRFVVPATGWLRVSTHYTDGGWVWAADPTIEVFTDVGGAPVPLLCGETRFDEWALCNYCGEALDNCYAPCRKQQARATLQVAAGTALFVSFGGAGSLDAAAPFVMASIAMLVPVANDVPAGAVPVSEGFDHRAVVARTLIETASPICPPLGGSDVWFSYVAPADGHLLVSTLGTDDGYPAGGEPGPAQGGYAAIWDAATYPTGGPTGCGFVLPMSSWLIPLAATRAAAPVVAGATYLVQIALLDGVFGGLVDFDVEFLPAPSVPFRRASPAGLPQGPLPAAFLPTVGAVPLATAQVAAAQAGGVLLSLKTGPDPYLPSNGFGSYWLALGRAPGGGPFAAWDDGTPLTYQNWAPGEPSASPAAERAVVDAATGLWRAVSSTERHYAVVVIPQTRVARTEFVVGSACPDDASWFLFADDPWMGGSRAGFTVDWDPSTPFGGIVFVYFSPEPASPVDVGGCFAFVDPTDVVLAATFVREAYQSPNYVHVPVTVPRLDAVVGLPFRLQALELPFTGGFRLSNAMTIRFGY
jgi:hypothetical protein